MQIDEKYMVRCLELAKNGRGDVAPNPMVGAVLVHNGRIIGEGYHCKSGEAHAEVNAIRSVTEPDLLPDSTLYVSLEPCSHYGKTPPCADLIIRMRIPRVVVACQDPFPEVSGRGIRMLREAGVEVVVGVMEEEAKALNHAFMTAHTKKRPYVFLKWAESLDGFMDKKRTDASTPPVLLSSPESRRMVHKLRSEMDAILVGTNTALLDNPSLTVRHWAGNSPVRVVLDRNLRLPDTLTLFDGNQRTLVYTEKEGMNRTNVEYVPIDFFPCFIPSLLDSLYKRGIHSLLVEGGSEVLTTFLKSGLWDQLSVETSPMALYDGVKAPDLSLYSVCRFGQKLLNGHLFTVYFPLKSFSKKTPMELKYYKY